MGEKLLLHKILFIFSDVYFFSSNIILFFAFKNGVDFYLFKGEICNLV